MSSASPAVSIGIDFGTSNTVVAIAADDRRVEAIRFDHGGQRHSVYVSALCFWEDRPGAGAQAEGGPWAIETFLEGRHVYRFLQSFKTFAASSSFQTTQVFRQRFKFEDILAAFLRTLARHGGEKFGTFATTGWHGQNTMVYMAQWAAGLTDLVEGQKKEHGQANVVEGRSYEGYCMLLGGKRYVSFHCYPAR